MKVSWLIDSEVCGSYCDEMAAAARELGHVAKVLQPPSPPYRWEDVAQSLHKSFPADSCVVAHGDIGLITKLARDSRWTPGVFATVANFDCASYYCHFGQHLLNQQYMMLPFGELRRCRDFLFDAFGVDDRIFVRPSSPLKLFTGQLASRATFDKDVDYMGFYEFPPESLAVVSRPQEIAAEWRFVIVDHKVVAGSKYSQGGAKLLSPECDEGAAALAEKIGASEYQPDPAWVADVCQTADGAYRLMEIGGFSFADLYACDKRAVVEAVSTAAMDVWKKSFS